MVAKMRDLLEAIATRGGEDRAFDCTAIAVMSQRRILFESMRADVTPDAKMHDWLEV